MAKKVKKISVWVCPDHGEIELINWTLIEAHCPNCGKLLVKTGEYTE